MSCSEGHCYWRFLSVHPYDGASSSMSSSKCSAVFSEKTFIYRQTFINFAIISKSIVFFISQNYCIDALQILRRFYNCLHTCSTDDPSFAFESGQVRFIV